MSKKAVKKTPMWIKVLVPVLIVTAIASMWWIKNGADAQQDSLFEIAAPVVEEAPIVEIQTPEPTTEAVAENNTVEQAVSTAKPDPTAEPDSEEPSKPREEQQPEQKEPEKTEPEEERKPSGEEEREPIKADFSLEITEKVDFDEISGYGIPVIIDYGSDSCIPCKQMAPALKALNEAMQGKAFVKFADVWKYSDAARNVPIQVIPSQIFINADGSNFEPSDELAAEIVFDTKSQGGRTFTVHQGGLTEEQLRRILSEMGVE